MADYYLKALFGAHIGANIISMPITELEIDTIKEVISRSCESVIDHDMLSDHEKEEQKRQMKQILEFFIHGIKDGLRYEGKLATVNEYVAKSQDANLHSLHPCHLNIFGFCLVVSDIIRIFDVVVGTLARNNKEKWIFLWFFAHLFVSLPQKDAGLVLHLLRFLEVHLKLKTI